MATAKLDSSASSTTPMSQSEHDSDYTVGGDDNYTDEMTMNDIGRVNNQRSGGNCGDANKNYTESGEVKSKPLSVVHLGPMTDNTFYDPENNLVFFGSQSKGFECVAKLSKDGSDMMVPLEDSDITLCQSLGLSTPFKSGFVGQLSAFLPSPTRSHPPQKAK